MAVIHPAHILCLSTAQQTQQHWQQSAFQSSMLLFGLCTADLSGFDTGYKLRDLRT